MTKYILQSDLFNGNITCFYNSKGLLVEYNIGSANIAGDAHHWILESMGYFLTDVLLIGFAKREGWECRKARIDLSFERFWRMYNNARHRMEAEKKWTKMTDDDRYYTLINLKAYIRYCKRNAEWYVMMLPESYLNGCTRDDWDRVIGKPTKKGDAGRKE